MASGTSSAHTTWGATSTYYRTKIAVFLRSRSQTIPIYKKQGTVFPSKDDSRGLHRGPTNEGLISSALPFCYLLDTNHTDALHPLRIFHFYKLKQFFLTLTTHDGHAAFIPVILVLTTPLRLAGIARELGHCFNPTGRNH